MIRARLRKALEWRLRAVTDRLDAIPARLDALEGRLNGLDQREGEMKVMLHELRELAALLPRTAEDASASRTAIDQHVKPVLRAILDEEAENRRRLFELRASPAYEKAYSDRDPLVSITLATVGRARVLLDRALPSLLSQTHSNLEVRVVGDAAAPGLGEEINALGDPRVHYTNLSQRLIADPERHWLVGSTMARNEAGRRAQGRWLLHFDDDDRLRPDAIASLLELAREQHAEVAYGGFEQHDPDGRQATCLCFPPRMGCFAWPAALVHGGLRFFERELVAASLELPGDVYMLERALRAGVRFAMLDKVVLDYFPSTLWKPSTLPAG